MDKEIILASSSPRRRSIMELLGLPFSVVAPSGIDETFINIDVNSEIQDLARRKAVNVLNDHPSAMVIGADTVVCLNGLVLGKPIDAENAFWCLQNLSGKTHSVITGVAIVSDEYQTTFAEKTLVTFRDIPDRHIWKYIETGLPMDKAGAYGIQDFGALFVKEIRGDFYNVVGFPVGRVWELLREIRGD